MVDFLNHSLLALIVIGWLSTYQLSVSDKNILAQVIGSKGCQLKELISRIVLH
jgi:hypothetical protein